MQNNAQSQDKRTRQSYISRWKKRLGGLGAPSRRKLQGFGGGAPDAVVIILLFSKKYTFLAYFCLNLCVKTRFKNLSKIFLCPPPPPSKVCAPARVPPLAFLPTIATPLVQFSVAGAKPL